MRTPWAAFVRIWEGEGFRRYLIRRGYRTEYDGAFFRRAFLECWAEPGFHRFWRIWNPSLGFLIFRLYRWIGGNRGEPLTKVLAFTASGVAHGVIVLPFLGWSWTLPVAFTCFGCMAAAGPRLSAFLRQRRWPEALNVPVNVAGVIGGFSAGFRLDELLSRL